MKVAIIVSGGQSNMTTKVQGQLEIDHNRGVIYFHNDRGITVLRICRLGAIPQDAVHIDITHKVGSMIVREPGQQPPVICQ